MMPRFRLLSAGLLLALSPLALTTALAAKEAPPAAATASAEAAPAPAPVQGGGRGRGRNAPSPEVLKLWNEAVRPAWKAAVLADRRRGRTL